jgi:hypothetical protein
MADTATARIEAYYDALRAGEPLEPFFAPDDDLVKCGISERLVGYDAVAESLREQTETTEDWTVGSEGLRVTERESVAWFGDRVRMAWTDTESGTRHDFDARWSGTLERRGAWLFVGMHVSAPREL